MHGCIYAAAATAGRDTGDEGDLSQEQPSWRDTSDDLGLNNIFCFLDVFTVGAEMLGCGSHTKAFYCQVHLSFG